VVPGGLRAGESLICPRCVEVADDDTDTAVLDADDIAAAYRLTEDELTSEEEYAAAMDNEQEWHLLDDGCLARARNRGAASGGHEAAAGCLSRGTAIRVDVVAPLLPLLRGGFFLYPPPQLLNMPGRLRL